MMEFSGRSALITGAASGIGAACARWLDQHGIGTLTLVDIDAVGLEALDLSCKVTRVVGDVADEAVWEAIEGRTDRLDHAVINAGIADGKPIVDQDFAGWRKMLAVNLDGAFLGLRTALRVMTRDRRDDHDKSIVLTGSVAGTKPLPFTAAYGTGKAAVAHLARIAAAEHASAGIRVNAVAPGRVDTPIWTKTDQFRALEAELGSREAAMQRLGEDAMPLGRSITGADIAGQIGFLLSDAAINVTGTVMVSDGGYSL